MIAAYYHAPTVLEGSDRMRGPDEQTSHMFSYLVARAARAPGPSAAGDPADDGRGAGGAVAALRPDVLGHRPAVDSARAAAAGAAAAVALHDAQRAAADGGDRLQHPVSLVRRAGHGRGDLVADDLQQEPRPPACRATSPRRSSTRWSRRRGRPACCRTSISRSTARCWRRGRASRASGRKARRPTEPPDDPGNPTVNFHGESRRNDTHQSTTDPDARLARKGAGEGSQAVVRGTRAARQSPRPGRERLRDGRHGDGRTRRRPAVAGHAPRAATVGGDKGFDVASFVAGVRALGVTPHVAQKVKGSAIDARTTRHAGYAISQRKRKLIEQVFGWMKTVGGLRKLRHRGGERGRLDRDLHRRGLQPDPPAHAHGRGVVCRSTLAGRCGRPRTIPTTRARAARTHA